MRWGDFELDLVSDGTFWLDGGAMFGVVPKVFWERKFPPDQTNRIKLGLNCLLVRGNGKTILIDTGCGFKYSSKELEIYGIAHERTVFDDLARLEVAPADIDLVINTHLHFDHCGGNTVCTDEGVVPAFSNATYVVQRQEFEDASHPSERTQASYLEQNWIPLVDRGQLELLEGNHTICEGIECIPTPGHTLGHQSVRIQSGGETLFFLGDLCPTSAHVPLPWIMSYDLYPATTLETRKEVYRQAVREGWTLFFEHDPGDLLGRLIEKDGNYRAETMPWETW